MESAGQSPAAAVTTSSIRIEHQDSRSAVNHAIQKIVDTFSSAIMKAGKPLPVGSPYLTPHKSAYKACHIQEYEVEDCWLYAFSRSNTSGNEEAKPFKSRLLYFAGGGFRTAPTKEHWLLCAELCTSLPEYEINLVSYPLAPNSPAPESIPQLERLYQALAKDAGTNNTQITLMGDSAGGNIALVMGIYGAAQYLANRVGPCPLQSIMAISPAVDHRNQHPEIDRLESKDRILNRATIEEVSQLWKGDWSVEDPRVSPTLADLSLLKKAGIKVDGVLGMDDVLTPDALVFREKLSALGVEGDWLDWEKQMHCFPLIFSHHVHEPVEAVKWIVKILRTNLSSNVCS